MIKTTALDFIPLWGIFLASTVLIVVAVETGFALGRRKLAKIKDGAPLHTGSAVAATLGLLAFMLAFTFGAGTSRLDHKRQLVLQETNAIATAFLRAELLPEPHNINSQDLLSRYIDHRLDMIEELHTMYGAKSKNQLTQLLIKGIAETKDFHSKMWAEAVEVAKLQPTPITALFISAVNQVLDLHQERITVAVQQRMRMAFWIALYCLATLAMGLTGYDAGVSHSRRNLSGWVVALAFSTVIVLVVGLDRPQTSAVEQTPLQELQRDMHAVLLGR